MSKNKNRIAIVEGYRTPMGKMGGALSKDDADILGGFITKEIYSRYLDYGDEISEVIFGNVTGPAHAQNIARVISLRAGIPKAVPAFTVHRNCASGMEAITSGIARILTNKAEVILAGGAESMSNVPFFFRPETKAWFEKLVMQKTLPAKLRHLLSIKLKGFSPVIGLKLGLTDPVCNMIMGDTAEILAQEFSISRTEQDEFACRSHVRAEKATKNGVFAEEIIPYPVGNKKVSMIETDEGIRNGQTVEALAKLRPFFDRKNGTVTAGNSSQITDGAAGCILMREEKAKALGIKPLGYVKDYAYTGCDPHRMGIGPAHAMAKILTDNQMKLKDIDLFEINEAFATQVIACVKALDSKEYCVNKLGLKNRLGLINMNHLNVNGGAVALGHPVGMTGARIIITLLRELKRQGKQTGIASLCIGGGQGGAVLLEQE